MEKEQLEKIKQQSELEYREFPTEVAGSMNYNKDIHCFKKRKAFVKGSKWAIEQMSNQWIPINKKSDLPKEFCHAWFFDKATKECMSGYFSPTMEECNFILANASHYIVIGKPEPPKV